MSAAGHMQRIPVYINIPEAASRRQVCDRSLYTQSRASNH
ncbi:hypothetical protein BRYFOR_06905 [Marvinbryantia formatexigens DSM 14469]|uniref:Uncharacterized protein n=1 Tax=Marvinbryantia formatexigens DSM 14469 TaxID=478749 RepID=C6LE56_9FIRM|nr:hypothetical protein BRYFOR_06905 [Marvinbryantia formatexigens DSM 14469]